MVSLVLGVVLAAAWAGLRASDAPRASLPSGEASPPPPAAPVQAEHGAAVEDKVADEVADKVEDKVTAPAPSPRPTPVASSAAQDAERERSEKRSASSDADLSLSKAAPPSPSKSTQAAAQTSSDSPASAERNAWLDVRVSAGAQTFQVWVDGQYFGPADTRVKVAAGKHTVEVGIEKPTMKRVVRVAALDTRVVSFEL
jgi:hypothetical protein